MHQKGFENEATEMRERKHVSILLTDSDLIHEQRVRNGPWYRLDVFLHE